MRVEGCDEGDWWQCKNRCGSPRWLFSTGRCKCDAEWTDDLDDHMKLLGKPSYVACLKLQAPVSPSCKILGKCMRLRNGKNCGGMYDIATGKCGNCKHQWKGDTHYVPITNISLRHDNVITGATAAEGAASASSPDEGAARGRSDGNSIRTTVTSVSHPEREVRARSHSGRRKRTDRNRGTRRRDTETKEKYPETGTQASRRAPRTRSRSRKRGGGRKLRKSNRSSRTRTVDRSGRRVEQVDDLDFSNIKARVIGDAYESESSGSGSSDIGVQRGRDLKPVRSGGGRPPCRRRLQELTGQRLMSRLLREERRASQ